MKRFCPCNQWVLSQVRMVLLITRMPPLIRIQKPQDSPELSLMGRTPWTIAQIVTLLINTLLVAAHVHSDTPLVIWPETEQHRTVSQLAPALLSLLTRKSVITFYEQIICRSYYIAGMVSYGSEYQAMSELILALLQQTSHNYLDL